MGSSGVLGREPSLTSPAFLRAENLASEFRHVGGNILFDSSQSLRDVLCVVVRVHTDLLRRRRDDAELPKVITALDPLSKERPSGPCSEFTDRLREDPAEWNGAPAHCECFATSPAATALASV